MTMTHKKRSKEFTWCGEPTTDESSLRWKTCTCKKCFDSAIKGRSNEGYQVSEAIRYTAQRWLEIKTEHGEIE